MKTIQASFAFVEQFDGIEILRKIETAGRTAYKSEALIDTDSASQFVAMLIKRGHFSVIEHHSVTVRVICDRGVSHEIVRHRLASYTQESTRYCNYTQGKFDGGLTFIEPCFWSSSDPAVKDKRAIWLQAIEAADKAYQELINLGATPEQARSVLPNSLKTEIVITMNLREWRHFFTLRTAPVAHPQMREITVPLLSEFKRRIPIIFDDIIPDLTC